MQLQRRGRQMAAAGALVLTALTTGCATPDPDQPRSGATGIVERKSVTDLTAEEKTDFVDAVLALKELPPPDETPAPDGSPVTNAYDWFVARHLGVLACDPDLMDNTGGFGHLGPTLLTWHRAFLLDFEKALSGAAGHPVSIPYWDWTDEKATATVFSTDFMGTGGRVENEFAVTEGPFREGKWTVTVKGFTSTNPGQFDHLVRAFGTHPDALSLPTSADVSQALLRPEYDSAPYNSAADPDSSFRQYLDGGDASGVLCNADGIARADQVRSGTVRLHGGVHLYVGGQFSNGDVGSLADCSTSPNDPVFWLHHANIDRITEAWWSTHDYDYQPVSGGRSGDNLADPLRSYGTFTNDDLASPTTDLGYRYAELPSVDGTAVLHPVADSSAAETSTHVH